MSDQASNAKQTTRGGSGESVTISAADSNESGANKSTVTEYLPPCRICNGVASGFHYGVNTCEACKAFFRRCTGQGTEVKPCPKGGNCTEEIRGRLVCISCRYEKCLIAGMTKEASKKGRYTHKLRTQYTTEIKGLKPDGAPKSVSSEEEKSYEETLSKIVAAAAESFPELKNFMDAKPSYVKRVNEMLQTYCPGEIIPVLHMYSGPQTAEMFPMKIFSDFLTLNYQQMSQTGGPPPTNLLWSSWMQLTELMFMQLLKFAKKLDGFRNLCVDDQISLLKPARYEVCTFIAHQSCVPEKFLIGMYSAPTEEILLIPINMFPDTNFDKNFGQDYIRIMSRLLKFDYNFEDMAVIIALLIFSTDRDDLIHPDQVEKLQLDLLPVLQYTLRKNQSGQANAFTETLLTLPTMREHADLIKRLWLKGMSESNADLSPLMKEIL